MSDPTTAALSALLVERVLPMFRGSETASHPWWWPLNHGAVQSDWLPGVPDDVIEGRTGLFRGQVLGSLRRGTTRAPGKVDVSPWEGFRGFFGSGPSPGAAIVSLTEAPGTGPYPTAVIATMMHRLDLLGLKRAHFTNIVKRRGNVHGPEGLKTHLDLLADELEVIARSAGRLVLCPNRTLARSKEQILLEVRARVASSVPDTEVVLLRGEEAPLALYSGHPQNPEEVLASWRTVLDRFMQ